MSSYSARLCCLDLMGWWPGEWWWWWWWVLGTGERRRRRRKGRGREKRRWNNGREGRDLGVSIFFQSLILSYISHNLEPGWYISPFLVCMPVSLYVILSLTLFKTILFCHFGFGTVGSGSTRVSGYHIYSLVLAWRRDAWDTSSFWCTRKSSRVHRRPSACHSFSKTVQYACKFESTVPASFSLFVP